MSGLEAMATVFGTSSPEEMRSFLKQWLVNTPADQRARTIQDALESPAGPFLRAQFGRWIVEQFIPATAVVPDEYAAWRPPIRDAMVFFGSKICDQRLAVKIVEQLELPDSASPERRLLTLISKVPGLQKLGQVLARNRRLRPSLRRALIQLENGIRDVTAQDIRSMIAEQLGPRLDEYEVEIDSKILSEASVSAVLRFTWRNPETGLRERGVFKVLKPYIPDCFSEDMDILHGLAGFFGARYREYGFAKHVLTDTFIKVRRLLRHEVDFKGEQRTLLEAYEMYKQMPGVRIPRLMPELCTLTITAMTEQKGVKVTDAVRGMDADQREHVAQQLMESLIAVPLFAAGDSALFHADPHAGNLLYDPKTGELVILDWALTERLTRERRRHMALLVFMTGLRDPVGVSTEIRALSEPRVRRNSPQDRMIRSIASQFFDELPLKQVPGAVDAMRLLQLVAVEGIRFPSSLIMLSKVLFTLDGILEDIGGESVSMAYSIARHPFRRWLTSGVRPGLPLTTRDWVTLQCSAALLGGRYSVKLQQVLLDKLLPGKPEAPAPAA